jgi:adenylosuccinate lyase
MERDAAYRVVQRNAMQSWEQRSSFRSLLESDDEVVSTLGAGAAAALDDAFSLTRSLRNAGKVFDALEEIPDE